MEPSSNPTCRVCGVVRAKDAWGWFLSTPEGSDPAKHWYCPQHSPWGISLSSLPVDPDGRPSLRIYTLNSGRTHVVSSRHGTSWASNERRTMALAMLAGLHSVGVVLDAKSEALRLELEREELELVRAENDRRAPPA